MTAAGGVTDPAQLCAAVSRDSIRQEQNRMGGGTVRSIGREESLVTGDRHL